jgi:hypothetical protein
MKPLEPKGEAPVVIVADPEGPEANTSLEDSATLPDPEDTPAPELMATSPPVPTEDPEAITTLPPSALLESPTNKDKLPAVPVLEIPVENTSDPVDLSPDPLPIRTLPLAPCALAPLPMITPPLESKDDAPLSRATLPEGPVVDRPVRMLIDPEDSLAPVANSRPPLLPFRPHP